MQTVTANSAPVRLGALGTHLARTRRGMRIHEVPVDWVDDPDSRVDIVSTALADLRGIARLAMATPLARFAMIGVASTLAYALLFLLLAGAVGSPAASAIALALTAVGNTAANRHRRNRPVTRSARRLT